VVYTIQYWVMCRRMLVSPSCWNITMKKLLSQFSRSQTAYNMGFFPNGHTYQLCQFYNTYAVYKDGNYRGQYWCV
jgi:hypothetical protein